MIIETYDTPVSSEQRRREIEEILNGPYPVAEMHKYISHLMSISYEAGSVVFEITTQTYQNHSGNSRENVDKPSRFKPPIVASNYHVHLYKKSKGGI